MKFFNTKIRFTALGYLAGIGLVLACAGGYIFEYGNSQFAPESFVDKKYSPFFYSYEYYYGISYDTQHNSRFNEAITDDWWNYLGKKYNRASVSALLIQTTSSQLDSVLKKKLPVALAQNEILKNSSDKKVNAFLEFLKWSKACETFALRTEDEWGYYGDTKPTPRASSKDMCLKLADAYARQKDAFLKTRYWFQWVRACYFNSDFTGTLAAFEKEKDAEKTTLYYRAMGYYAGALYKQKKFAESNYYFSLVYNYCDALKPMAHFSFKPQQESDWQNTLALCKTNDEKATLWQMLGIQYGDELRAMKEIAALDPSSEKLDVLLARAVNHAENSNLNDAYNSVPAEKAPGVNDYVSVFSAILDKKPQQAYKWQMALGYLYAIGKQHEKAQSMLKEARKTVPDNALAKAQLRQLQLIADVQALNRIDGKTENRLLPEFQWLKQVRNDSAFAKLRPHYTWQWLQETMAARYRKQGDALKAEWFVPSGVYYMSTANCEAMKTFLKKPDKSGYEAFGQSVYAYSYEAICEYQGIKVAYSERIEESIAFMEQAAAFGESKLLSNPFNGGIKDCHDCDHALPQKTIYTKLSTLKKMKEMYAALPNDTYNNALLLANAYYNMSYYGSSRLFYECDIVGRGYMYPATADSLLTKDVFSMTNAGKYYRMALQNAKTDEQKAKCTYMLAKCERNEWYNSINNDTYKQGVDFKAWPSFKVLTNFAATKYYKEVIKECGYFRTFTMK